MPGPLLPHIKWTGEASLASDIAFRFYDSISSEITSSSQGTLVDRYRWCNDVSNILLDAISFSIPNNKPEFMKNLNIYFLKKLNEIQNFGLLVQSMQYSNEYFNYNKAIWHMHSGDKLLSKRLLFSVASYIQLNMDKEDNLKEAWFIRGPWFYLHSINERRHSYTSCNISSFFDILFYNIQG